MKAKFCRLNESLIQRRNSMNNEEAKLILQAYRSGGQDANDSRFRDALAQAQRDPELARWFANEHALDSRISAKLKSSVKPPAHLKSQLIAQQKIARPAAWWRQTAWLTAAAALFVLLATLTAVWLSLSDEPQFAVLRDLVVKDSLRETDHLSFTSENMEEITGWLKEQNVSTDFELPASLRDAPVHGCRVIEWQGHKVTLLCFMPNDSEHIDLFVIDCTRFRDFKPLETLQFASSDGVTTATWSSHDRTYLAVSTGSEQQLRRIL
jgi:anti-sigma factor RsiW